jgi:hypothetical protein
VAITFAEVSVTANSACIAIYSARLSEAAACVGHVVNGFSRRRSDWVSLWRSFSSIGPTTIDNVVKFLSELV